MTSPASPKFPTLDDWLDPSSSPSDQKTRPTCECVCHSRKITMIMIEQLDAERISLKDTIEKINMAIETLSKTVQHLSTK